MRYSTASAAFLTLGLVAFAAGPAAAQGPAPADMAYFHFNFGSQPGTHNVDQTLTQSIYDETASLTMTQPTKVGTIIDFGGGVRVYPNLYVGISITTGSQANEGAVTAQVPHPFVTDLPRSATATVPDLQHSETAFHIEARYRIPVTTEFDLSVFAGPSFVSVKQDVATGFTVTEVGSPFNQVNITNVAISEESETVAGFSFGLDGTYMFTRNVGAGGFFRYVGVGDADIPVAGGDSLAVNAGGAQIGAGVRIRF
jgi:Outer membrane protein beta-barrel domain